MKSLFGILSLVSVVAGANAYATGYVSCTNGNIETMGDALYKIDLLEDGIQFQPWESGFTVDAADVSYDNGTYSIVNKTVDVSAEGEEFTSVLNAILIKTPGKLIAAVSLDKAPFSTFEMKCVKRN